MKYWDFGVVRLIKRFGLEQNTKILIFFTLATNFSKIRVFLKRDSRGSRIGMGSDYEKAVPCLIICSTSIKQSNISI